MRDRAQRLAHAPRARAGVRQGIVRARVRDWRFALQHLPNDRDVLARARERLVERLPVPALDDLRARNAEAERHAPARQVIERERVHRGRGGRACGDLHHRRAEPDLLGVRSDPGERRERVGAPGLGGEDDVVAEALGLLRDVDEAGRGLVLPVAELKSELELFGHALRLRGEGRSRGVAREEACAERSVCETHARG